MSKIERIISFKESLRETTFLFIYLQTTFYLLQHLCQFIQQTFFVLVFPLSAQPSTAFYFETLEILSNSMSISPCIFQMS